MIPANVPDKLVTLNLANNSSEYQPVSCVRAITAACGFCLLENAVMLSLVSQMLKVPCNPIGASPIPRLVINPDVEFKSAETGGTLRQNSRHHLGFIDARVSAAVSPSHFSGTGLPNGDFFAQVPFADSGSSSMLASVRAIFRHCLAGLLAK